MHVWGYVGTRAQILGEHTKLKLIFSPILPFHLILDSKQLTDNKHPYIFDTSKWFPWSTMDVRGANTFPLHNRLPNPLLVVRPFLSFGVLSLFSLSFGINKIRWRLCIFRGTSHYSSKPTRDFHYSSKLARDYLYFKKNSLVEWTNDYTWCSIISI